MRSRRGGGARNALNLCALTKLNLKSDKTNLCCRRCAAPAVLALKTLILGTKISALHKQEGGDKCEEWRLARFLHVLGHVAVKQLALAEDIGAQQQRDKQRADDEREANRSVRLSDILLLGWDIYS